MAYNISLSCRKETHEAYKKFCNERRLSVSSEFQKFMENEIECKAEEFEQLKKDVIALQNEIKELKENKGESF